MTKPELAITKIRVIFLIIGIYLNRNKEKLEKPWINFLVQVIITVLGVTLAIILTNIDDKNKGKEQTIEFLKTVSEEVKEKSDFGKVTLKNCFTQTDMAGATINSIKLFPMNDLTSLEVLLTEQPYATTISNHCYGALLGLKFSTSVDQLHLEEDSEAGRTIFSLLTMNIDLDIINQVIKTELEYQNNQINNEELYDKLQILVQSKKYLELSKYYLCTTCNKVTNHIYLDTTDEKINYFCEECTVESSIPINQHLLY